jgi:D-beta-D-heptose 7-phosphate kinase/D-beta-D-heptose 1-phosphate adenosyltransferase
MSARHLADVIDRLARPRILVIGDVMLDHYVFGAVERISPEAPIQVLRVEREERRPGGAGSVAAMLRKLEAEVALVSAIGRDQAGDEILEALCAIGCDVSGVVRIEGRPTTEKTRMIAEIRAGAGAQHVLRVDRETTERYAAEVEAEILGHLRRLFPGCALAIVSDYGKGLFRGALVPEIAALARAHGRPVLADPKGPDYSIYRGLTAITPNRAETEAVTGMKLRDPDSWRAAGEKLVRDLDLESAIITLDKDGIFWCPREGEARHFPTTARSVYDVTGAGDMVISTIGLARASGIPWEDALPLANVAAGLEITRVGVAALTRREIRNAALERDGVLAEKIWGLEAFLREVLPAIRHERKKIAFTNGCFDLLHVGHVKLLEFARGEGDVLVVGLNSDRSTREIKGPGRPILSEKERAHLLAALSAVDYVIVFDEPTPIRLIEAIVPDVLVKAADYEGKVVVGQSVVERAGGRVALAPLVGGISTTEILRRAGAAPGDEAAARAARAAAEQVYEQVERRAETFLSPRNKEARGEREAVPGVEEAEVRRG